MATSPRGKTPRRTTGHIIADLGVNYVERLFLEAGHSPMGVPKDYGYDVTVITHNRRGYAETGLIYLQLKASRRLRRTKGKLAYPFSISREHYNLWRYEPMPAYLVRYCHHLKRAYWLYLQAYFQKRRKLFKNKDQQTATIYIPMQNRLDAVTIKKMRAKKQEAVHAARKAIEHKIWPES